MQIQETVDSTFLIKFFLTHISMFPCNRCKYNGFLHWYNHKFSLQQQCIHYFRYAGISKVAAEVLFSSFQIWVSYKIMDSEEGVVEFLII
jgi:hypothetical protein